MAVPMINPLAARLSAAPIVPLWLIIVLLAAGISAVYLQYRIVRRKLGPGKALLLSLLRLSTFCLLLLFALNLSLTNRKEHRVAPEVAIIVDTSPSMGLPSNGKEGTRLDEARRALMGGATAAKVAGSAGGERKPLLASLEERYDVKLYALGDSLREIEGRDLSALKPVKQSSGFNDALREISGKASLVIFLSDGTTKPETTQGVVNSPLAGSSQGSLSKELPVLTIPVGDPNAYKDILISGVKAPPVAFRGREVTIDATITNRGYKNVTVPVLLQEGSKLVTAKSVHFKKDRESITVSFSFTPHEIRFAYDVDINAAAGRGKHRQ